MAELTQLLKQAQAGDPDARDALFAAAYPGLQQLARARLRDGGRNTMLDTRSLVHESYLRYVQAGELRAVKSGGDTLVSGDVNGDGTADFMIRIDGEFTLNASHFSL